MTDMWKNVNVMSTFEIEEELNALKKFKNNN